MAYRKGDRVRIKNPTSEYTGCRGTIADDAAAGGPDVTVLGHQVAIDGENGVVRPFLVSDLEAVQAARVRQAARHGARAPQPRDADGGAASE